MSALRNDLFLEVSFPADWSRIDPTREAISLLVLAVFGSVDLRDSLAMVSAELLENAVKYSKPMSGVRLSIRQDGGAIVIAVTNSVDEATSHLATLQERLLWLQSFESPALAYMAALDQVSTRGGDDSGLGLFRIAYEGGCSLQCDVSEPGSITMRAHCNIGQAA